MAKKDKTAPNEAANASQEGAALVPSDNLPLVYGQWATDARALGWPEGLTITKPLAYVIANGFKQSMTDASAITKEQKEKLLKDATEAGHDVTMEQVVEAHAIEQRAKRFADILAGSVGIGGGGPKLPQIDRVMREIAEEQIRAAVVAKGMAMPKGDSLKVLIDKRLSVAGDAIRTAAQGRIDSAKSMAAELDDILS